VLPQPQERSTHSAFQNAQYLELATKAYSLVSTHLVGSCAWHVQVVASLLETSRMYFRDCLRVSQCELVVQFLKKRMESDDIRRRSKESQPQALEGTRTSKLRTTPASAQPRSPPDTTKNAIKPPPPPTTSSTAATATARNDDSAFPQTEWHRRLSNRAHVNAHRQRIKQGHVQLKIAVQQLRRDIVLERQEQLRLQRLIEQAQRIQLDLLTAQQNRAEPRLYFGSQEPEMFELHQLQHQPLRMQQEQDNLQQEPLLHRQQRQQLIEQLLMESIEQQPRRDVNRLQVIDTAAPSTTNIGNWALNTSAAAGGDSYGESRMHDRIEASTLMSRMHSLDRGLARYTNPGMAEADQFQWSETVNHDGNTRGLLPSLPKDPNSNYVSQPFKKARLMRGSSPPAPAPLGEEIGDGPWGLFELPWPHNREVRHHRSGQGRTSPSMMYGRMSSPEQQHRRSQMEGAQSPSYYPRRERRSPESFLDRSVLATSMVGPGDAEALELELPRGYPPPPTTIENNMMMLGIDPNAVLTGTTSPGTTAAALASPLNVRDIANERRLSATPITTGMPMSMRHPTPTMRCSPPLPPPTI
jgi:hypothetical protein